MDVRDGQLLESILHRDVALAGEPTSDEAIVVRRLNVVPGDQAMRTLRSTPACLSVAIGVVAIAVGLSFTFKSLSSFDTLIPPAGASVIVAGACTTPMTDRCKELPTQMKISISEGAC